MSATSWWKKIKRGGRASKKIECAPNLVSKSLSLPLKHNINIMAN